jgi:phosphoglycerate dehydrogenase-like enzyme
MAKKNTITTVLATVPYTGWHIEKLRSAFAPAKVIQVNRDDVAGISQVLKEAEVAVLQGDLNDQIINEGKKLRWIHCDHAGVNNSARPEIFERGIILTSSAGRSGPVLAEHTFFLTLSLIYASHALHDAQKEHRWRGIPNYDDRRGLYSKTMGVIGLGYTGKEIAARAHVFGMHVLGYDRLTMENPPGVDKMYCAQRGETIDELLKESDVVALSVRLSDETYHMINERTLRLMKPTAYLINMARGSVVDEPALAAALREGRIGGAGLDVFEQEPLPASSPLWDMPNVVMTPHMTPEMPDIKANALVVIAENVKRFLEGKPLINALAANDVYTKGRRG